jgi:tRNA-splicing ligase RtcB
MSNLVRLQKALKRQGIDVSYQSGVYRLRNPQAEASVLLPESLPLEEKAVKQLVEFASVQVPGQAGHVCKACATPDFHPGSIAPVGSVVATSPDLVIPAAIGTDINCGMRLVRTGLGLAEVEARQGQLIAKLTRVLLENGRDVPVKSAAFAALFDAGPEAWIDTLHRQGMWAAVDRGRLHAELQRCIGLGELKGALRYAPEALVGTREIIRDPNLGTMGSGNHFVELQVVDRVMDRQTAYDHGLAAKDVVFMIHSGSRDVGFYVGQRWMDRAKHAWPAGVKHPQSGLYGLSGDLAEEYLLAMGGAARYAWANRVVLAELVRGCFRDVFGDDKSSLVVDVPHNVVLVEQGLNVHRKGATPARAGDLALIPGSMGDYSYVAQGLGNPEWLWSCSHGAGRRMRRQAIRAAKPSADSDSMPWNCVTLKEERRVEESPAAYKRIGPVLEAQEEAGLIAPVARLKPWTTFKA